MKKLLLVLSAQFLLYLLHGQSAYWQQQVNFTIDVSLNDKEHSLDGFERIEYINNSPDTLSFIWFHIWPNAYKNDKTAFSDQLLENGQTSFYFSEREKKGYINRLDFSVDNQSAETRDHPEHIDIVQLLLPTPLAPGKKAIITTPFHVKLPFNFSRGGHDGQSYQLTQWYPKPAVYDQKGWHPMPYLDQGEFYAEFGNYTVNISLPANYVVAATGQLQNKEERDWLLNTRKPGQWDIGYIASHPMKNYDTLYNYQPGKKKVIQKGKTRMVPVEYTYTVKKTNESVSNVTPRSATQSKTLTYSANNVHDFAWFADKRFIVEHDTLLLSSGRSIDLFSFYTPREQPWWKESISCMKQAATARSEWIGEYPYPVISVVQGPPSFGGGMEYPAITIISPDRNKNLLHYTIAHEIGHNWFYGILGSNEREYPWLDEGLNSYYDNRYSQLVHGDKGELTWGKERLALKDAERLLFNSKAAEKKDQPINTPAAEFTDLNYNLVAYYKTAAWLEYLEAQIGRTAFDSAIKKYYQQWKFKHPTPDDFKKSFATGSDKILDSSFALLNEKGRLPGIKPSGTKLGFLFNRKFLADQVRNPSKNIILFSPAIGLNSYDKISVGALFTNMSLPAPKFQFLVAPMYGTGSSRLTGIGLASYSFFPTGIFRKIDVGVSAATFSINEFTDPNNNEKISLGFHKIVPGLRLTLKEKSARSTTIKFLQFKSFLIGEDELRFSRDSVFTPGDTLVTDRFTTANVSRTLNQLKFVLENYRALYPYKAEFKIEQGKGFTRAAFTGNYFFNYAGGGGLNVRLFAGKFMYNGSKTINKQFETDRYHLNMTGANGYEDYTYSDYFAGRNEFEGFASQQIMVRDGGFKVRTDLLASKVGRSDDWLTAVNFSTSLPNNLNPLSILPIDIPIRIFVDIGSYAAAWERNANTDRFLFDAGIHLPFLKETVNIYIPLLYSKVYKDYIQSTIEKKGRFFKTISFSIDISNFSFRKFNRNLDF